MNNNSTLLIKYCDAYITAHINNTKEKQIQIYHNHYKKKKKIWNKIKKENKDQERKDRCCKWKRDFWKDVWYDYVWVLRQFN